MEIIGVKTEYNHNEWLTIKEKKKIKVIFSDFEYRDF
jgi:hypothetical protein